MAETTPIGIDLGTTRSVIAFVDKDGRPATIKNAEGETTTPSVVFFDDSGPIIGREAADIAAYEPEQVIQFAKRHVGELFLRKKIAGTRFPPEVIQALILRKLKSDAELLLHEVRDVVITVPAYFNEPRRKATQDSGRLLGLNVLDIINEPTAAAIAYGVQKGFLSSDVAAIEKETVLVYDLGGGTFDVTVMKIDGRDYSALSTAGDVYLGGIDWDDRIVTRLAETFEQEHGVDPREDEAAKERLRVEAEKAKIALTARHDCNVHFEYKNKRLRLRLTRDEFESMSGDLLQRTLFTTRKVLKEAELEWSDLTRILLVGGASRMPMIGEALANESGIAIDRSISPDEAVAHGAAIYAGVLTQADESERAGLMITNVNSHDLNILATDAKTGLPRRKIMVPRNTALPAGGSGRFKTKDVDQRSVLINVVEGGDASGRNSTPIGKCHISDLPPGLPAKTAIEVRFLYEANGRLKIEAWLPAAKHEVTLTMDRPTGLNQATFEEWKERISSGLLFDPADQVVEEDAVEHSVEDVEEIEEIDKIDLNEPEGEIDDFRSEVAGILDGTEEEAPEMVDADDSDQQRDDPDLNDFLKQLP